MQIRRIFNDVVADDAWKANPHVFRALGARQLPYFLHNPGRDDFCRHPHQRLGDGRIFGKTPNRPHYLVINDDCGGNPIRDEYSNAFSHACRFPSGSAQLVQAVKSCCLVALRQSRVIEHGVDEVVNFATQDQNRLADVQQLGCTFPNDMNTQ